MYLLSLSVIPYTLDPVFSFDDTIKSREKMGNAAINNIIKINIITFKQD